jgi:hypothetical protein
MNTTTKLDRINDYWTIAGLAEALGVSEHTLHDYITRKAVPITKLAGTPLVKLADMDSYRARIGNVRKLLASG